MDILSSTRLLNRLNIRAFPSRALLSGKILKNGRNTSTSSLKEEENYSIIADDDYEASEIQKEQTINIKRNKSRLKPQHRNIVLGRIPYDEPMAEHHLTFKYNRVLFGKYGKSSGINPGSLWPSSEDIEKRMEYEAIAFPLGFHDMVGKQKKILEEEQIKTNERQQKIINNLKRLDAWKKEITARAEKKLADIAKAKAKKDALIEEVRRHFGYKVDPKDEKFKEMLLIKEREQKRKLKEERSKVKQEKFLSELLNKKA